MIYFFDNNISYRYVRMLTALDVQANALREEFQEDISDVDLFNRLRGKDNVFITGDERIRRREVEAKALRQCKITSLFLGPFWAKMTFWDQAVWLVTKWPKIDGFASNVAQGTCAELKRNGKALPFSL